MVLNFCLSFAVALKEMNTIIRIFFCTFYFELMMIIFADYLLCYALAYLKACHK